MIIFIVPIFIILFFNSVFIVDQAQQVIVTEFGRLSKIHTNPGLHFRVPFVQSIHYYEKRVLNCDVSEVELTLGDQKRLVVDVFARYYIADPVLFFKSVYNQSAAAKRLKLIIIGDVRDILGKVSLQDILTTKREDIVNEIHNRVEKAVKVLGIGMMEVRIKKAVLPEENNEAVFNRMRSDRMKEAQEWRGKAEQTYREIISNADLEAAAVIANARREADAIRGEADASAINILQSCYSKDKEFSELILNLESYKKTLGNGRVKYWLSSKHPYFNMLNKNMLNKKEAL
ncbi:protease modulator HflC [Candidatus Cytomitobacter primus]|uniref:Protein HflC n=1 Tax=Candidatus Cytomitobacter primus TaxID=2066024 RepID=A0A5C0UGY2_9PROT|nr:protease modulator HflC [Candidatus Cytomitobacter primus]QEK38803.1 protease modulator HflC [Candidatus Cytomitobacter primus]